MKYILTFISGVTVGLLTAIGIYAAEEHDQEKWRGSINEDEVVQEEIQTH